MKYPQQHEIFDHINNLQQLLENGQGFTLEEWRESLQHTDFRVKEKHIDNLIQDEFHHPRFYQLTAGRETFAGALLIPNDNRAPQAIEEFGLLQPLIFNEKGICMQYPALHKEKLPAEFFQKQIFIPVDWSQGADDQLPLLPKGFPADLRAAIERMYKLAQAGITLQ